MHLFVASVVDGVWNSALDLLWESLLEGLWDLGVTNGMGDLASLLVGAGVVDGVWKLVLKLAWDLDSRQQTAKLFRMCETDLLLNLLWDLRVGGVGNTLALLVLHVDGCLVD